MDYPLPPDPRHEEASSDCTYPETLDLRDKKSLLRWRYARGGERLGRYIPRIPHVDETTVKAAASLEEQAQTAELSLRIINDAKQAQQEYVFVKQKFDLLKQKRDLLKWHVASSSKFAKIREGQVQGVQQRNQILTDRLKTAIADVDRSERDKVFLSASYDKLQRDVETLIQEFRETDAEMAKWLSRRGDYLADITVERRKAGKERALRTRQLKKLFRACNNDSKWHVKIEAARDADNLIFDAYENAANQLVTEFNRAGDITGPLRLRLFEEFTKEREEHPPPRN